MNKLYYGDNLDVLGKYIKDETVDLCYIDPPFNSKRDYNQIYNNIGREDRAQVQAFVDTWEWDDSAREGFEKFDLATGDKRYPEKTKLLINGFEKVLGQGSMLAYIVSITQRIMEIYRVLKPTGSFYLHCDPTASHYLKLILDSVFCQKGGVFRNEIIWHYTGNSVPKNCFPRKHDTLFSYSKSQEVKFEPKNVLVSYSLLTEKRYNHIDEAGRRYKISALRGGKQEIVYMKEGKYPDDVWDIPVARGRERLGYPTQKPEKLLERIILASSNEGDTVLDAYCGCGTTVAVAQRLKRKWIGIDITYQSISLIIKRLTESFGKQAIENIDIVGIPKDMESAKALSLKSKTRKEFEIWSIMTYSNNRAIPNERRGADRGIDGRMYITTSLSPREQKPVLFSVKSGHVSVAQIRDFLHVIEREKAVAGVFITLEEPTRPMLREAKDAGTYLNPLTNLPIDRLQIVTIRDILKGERSKFPHSEEVLNKATRKADNNQLSF
ncbi:MAG: restriction endonuclease subunit M [Bacteroidales bacterium]